MYAERFRQQLAKVEPCTETRVKIWESGNPSRSDEWLGEDPFLAKLPDLSSTLTSPTPQHGPPRFTLVTSVGDSVMLRMAGFALMLSSRCLTALIQAWGLPSEVATMLTSTTYNLSRHLHFDNATGKPWAISLLLRIPRTSQSVNCAMKIRLSDRACVCFLFSRQPHVADALRDRCIEQASLLAIHPLYMLHFILEERTAMYDDWLQGLFDDVYEIEAVTDMVPPSWKKAVQETKRSQLADIDELLKQLHSTNTELSACGTVMKFAVKFGEFVLHAIDAVEDVRAEQGLDILRRHDRSRLTDCVRFVHDRNQFRQDKLDEVLRRLGRQINVTFSLVTQRDSKVNLAVAEDSNRVAGLAAQDSETMKTITILTLVFLPSTLVTSIWSTGIIQLDDDTNWKVYAGTTVTLTVVVIATWLLFLRISRSHPRRHQPLHIAGLGYVREGKFFSRANSS